MTTKVDINGRILRRSRYAPLLRLPSSGWAWEFLRRNPAYIADWQEAGARESALKYLSPTMVLKQQAEPDPRPEVWGLYSFRPAWIYSGRH